MCKMIAVVGPTASGKSNLAVEIAKFTGGEVVSCDSMQIYKHMDIGTAKPTVEEMQGIPHHLVDFLSPGTEYSVSDYVKDAEACVNEITSRGKKTVFCGGTGLYISSFLSGIKFGEYENNPMVRYELLNRLENEGVDVLYNELCSIDNESASAIEKNNAKRVVRALEVYYTTGITMAEWNRRSLINAKPKEALVIGLDFEDRQKLYDRIDFRVDVMINKGLVEEAKWLYDMKILETGTASQAIAYKEFIPYFEGTASLEECVEILKRNSRRYAKRQLTWFRRDKNVHWIYRDACSSEKEIIQKACSMCEQFLQEVKP